MTVETGQPLALGLGAGAPASFQHLNTLSGWPSIRPEWLVGLVVDPESRTLELAAVPGAGLAVGPSLPAGDGSSAGVGGIAVDRDCNLYLADAAASLIWRVDACDGRGAPLRCLGGTGGEPGRLDRPAGLAVGPRGWLYVVDSGNHRVQVVDLATLQLRDVIGQPDPSVAPRPGDAPGRFNGPSDVVFDSTGSFYVADQGNARVQKFDPSGRVLPAFSEAVLAGPVKPQRPTSLALWPVGADELLLVVDGADGRVLAYDRDGRFDAAASAAWPAVEGGITRALALGGVLYAGDSQGRIHALTATGAPLGVVSPFGAAGPIVGLAADCQERLLVRQLGGPTLRLEPGAARVRCGTFLAGPLTVGTQPTSWQRIAAIVGYRPEGSRVQLFTLSSDWLDGASPATTPAAPAACAGPVPAEAIVPDAEAPVPLDSWRAGSADALDFLALNQPGRYLWIAGILHSTGQDTPRLEQIRVEFGHESWMQYLPAVYRRGDASPSFADPAMLLLESMLDDLEGKIDGLPGRLDAGAAPDDAAPASWLDWLAGWLALELSESWSGARRREAVRGAFAAHGRRGTVESLRELVELNAGVSVRISEPALATSIWSLGEGSTLGSDTMLASAHPDGAIVGTTSTLGQSHLITADRYGAPLFDEVAHRFCVSAYAVDLPDEAAIARVREVLDREKPAHTSYHLCPIGPSMRVGVQAQIGVDTIIGDVAGAFVPGREGLLGNGTVLPGLPPDAPVRVGRTTSLRGDMTIA